MKWLFAFLCFSAQATTYYVRVDGNDGNSGTVNSTGGAWLHIAHAAGVVNAGDNVRVQPGTYNEQPTLSRSGSAGNFINYVCDGSVVCRGFDLNNVNYNRIIGFEITHVDNTFDNGIIIENSCDHDQIIDNYIHFVKDQGIKYSSATPTYITYRGNTIFYVGVVPGVATNSCPYGIQTWPSAGHILAEYNIIQRAADVFITSYGTNDIIRNNYLWDFKNIYWNSDNSCHSDIFQDGSDGQQVFDRYHVYERNLCGDCWELNSHFGIWQDVDSHGDTNNLIRGNVVYNFGSGGIGVKDTSDKLSSYNNTFWNMGTLNTGTAYESVFACYAQGGAPRPPIAPMIANTLISTCTNDTLGSSISIISQGPFISTNNLGFNCPVSDPSYVSTADPQFVSIPSHNFRVQSGSPARGKGTNLVWVTSSNGSGTSFTVNDSQLLIDGWGIVDGDTITVGKGGTPTVITAINWGTQTITVRDSVTWTNKMPVYWGTDTGPDIGAYPFASTNLTAATITRSGTGGSIYTVTTTGDARGAWFYANGIPVYWASSPPLSYTNSTDTVTAKAYALWAQQTPVITATPAFPPQVINVSLIFSGKATASGKVLMQ